MTADNDILILYVDFGEGQSLTTRLGAADR